MQESVKLVLDKVELLCQTLGMKATEFFPYAVKQQILQGWMFVLIGIISVISGVILYKKGKDTSDASPIFIMLYGIGFISLLSFGVGITRVLNPEYSAVMGILEMMKQ